MMTEHTVVNVQEAPHNNQAKPNQPSNEPLSWIKINLDYFKTTPGLLKIAELILGILCMSLGSPGFSSSGHFFLFVVTTSFIGTLIWVFIYLLGIREALNLPINWIATELLNTAICTVCYIIATILQLIAATSYDNYHRRGSYIAAGVFGILNTLVYGFATYLLHLEWKSSRSTN